MESLKLAVCDDEIVLLPQLSSVIAGYFRRQHLETETQTYSDAASLLRAVHGGTRFDVYFLDIDIPEQDGITLAEKIETADPEAKIIYVSAREERVYDTFPTRPIAFVRKSNFSEDMAKAMDTLMKFLRVPEDRHITFPDEAGHPVEINVDRLIYVEAKEKYQHLVGVSRKELVRCSITDLESALTPYGFARIHRGYLVNLRYIYKIDTADVKLDDGTALPMSRYRRREVQERFLTYVRSGS